VPGNASGGFTLLVKNEHPSLTMSAIVQVHTFGPGVNTTVPTPYTLLPLEEQIYGCSVPVLGTTVSISPGSATFLPWGSVATTTTHTAASRWTSAVACGGAVITGDCRNGRPPSVSILQQQSQDRQAFARCSRISGFLFTVRINDGAIIDHRTPRERRFVAVPK
jgi:hypothetical protein